MSRRIVRVAAAATAAVLGAALAASVVMAQTTARNAAPAAAAPFDCSSAFVALITRGPDRGKTLRGQLVLTLTPGGSIGGALVSTKHAIQLRGSLNGSSFQLQIPSAGGAITGVGTASTPITRCATIPKSGTLTGPRAGDKGTWDTMTVTVCHYILGIPIYCLTVTSTKCTGSAC